MTFDIDELFTGVGIVIDDAFLYDEDKKDDIFKIVDQINENNIPIVKYHVLPDKAISHFKNVSFILLDWDLNQITPSATEPISTPSGLESSNVEQNIEFIKNIKKVCFTPFFIFTKEDVDEVINKLIDASLYSKENHNFIFVKNKSELKRKGNLFSKIKLWLKETTSIYVLKEWEVSLNEAKNNLFWDFYELNPDWPKVLWKAYKEDNVNMAAELGAIITRNLNSRISHFGFDKQILSKNIFQIQVGDMITVIEGDRFIEKGSFKEDELNTGDIFKKNGKYFINIRPQCDCVPRENENLDDIEIYCLKGSKLNDNKIKDLFDKEYGLFREQDDNCILFPIDKGKAVDIRFKKLYTFLFKDLKSNYIGQLLPPHIVKVQQKYSSYLHRPGLSRLPVEVVKEDNL